MHLYILKVNEHFNYLQKTIDLWSIDNYWWHNEIYDQPTYQIKQLLVSTIGYGCTEWIFKVVEFKAKVM